MGDYDLENTTLRTPLPNNIDVLVVIAPTTLTDEQVFEIDQFLMKGGTVIVAAGAYETMVVSQSLSASPNFTGLEDWLAHHGISIEQSMILDPRNSAFPVPVLREVGGLTFQELRMIDYPFFVDVRNEGIVDTSTAVKDLDQLTYAWGSPLNVSADPNSERDVVELLRSSEKSWTDASPEVMPKFSNGSVSPYTPTGVVGSQLLAVSLKGQFSSYFDESPAVVEARERARELEEMESIDLSDELPVDSTNEGEALEGESTSGTELEELNEVPPSGDDLEPSTDGTLAEESTDPTEEGQDVSDKELAGLETQEEEEEEEEEEDTLGVVGSVIDHSPESARLVVIGSSEFVSDYSVRMISSSRGSLYVNTHQFLSNLIDVAMEDASLLSIRSRGHFNRSLPSLTTLETRLFEFGNYVAAVVGLGIVFGINVFLRIRRRTDQANWFGA